MKMKNKRPPVKKEAKEAVYVGIPLDDVLKTEMLDCSKDLIHFLQAYEKFKVIREEKTAAIEATRRKLGEITTLTAKLKRLFPKSRLTSLCGHKAFKQTVIPLITKSIKASAPRAPLPPQTHQDDLDQLEKELAEIEKQLGK